MRTILTLCNSLTKLERCYEYYFLELRLNECINDIKLFEKYLCNCQCAFAARVYVQIPFSILVCDASK